MPLSPRATMSLHTLQSPDSEYPSSSQSLAVGFVGLGSMGWPMAMNLRKRLPPEITLYVHDFNHNLVKRFMDDLGGRLARCDIYPCESPHEVTERSEIIFVIDSEGERVRSVFLDPNGLLSHSEDTIALKTFVDCSTIDTATSLSIADAVRSASSSEARFYDAPVSGGIPCAVASTLTFMVGVSSDESVDPYFHGQIQPFLSFMGTDVLCLGGPGLGLVGSLSNNYLSGIIAIATSKAINIGTSFGIDPMILRECLRNGSVSNGRNGTSGGMNRVGENLLGEEAGILEPFTLYATTPPPKSSSSTTDQPPSYVTRPTTVYSEDEHAELRLHERQDHQRQNPEQEMVKEHKEVEGPKLSACPHQRVTEPEQKEPTTSGQRMHWEEQKAEGSTKTNVAEQLRKEPMDEEFTENPRGFRLDRERGSEEERPELERRKAEQERLERKQDLKEQEQRQLRTETERRNFDQRRRIWEEDEAGRLERRILADTETRMREVQKEREQRDANGRKEQEKLKVIMQKIQCQGKELEERGEVLKKLEAQAWEKRMKIGEEERLKKAVKEGSKKAKEKEKRNEKG